MFNRKLKAKIKELESQMIRHNVNIHSLHVSDLKIQQNLSELEFRTNHIKAPARNTETVVFLTLI
jgi:hypothetical protein